MDALDPSIRARALHAPEDFVLKPQREGGGNNLYGAAIRDALLSKSRDELSSFVLMERIRPAPQANTVLLRHNQPTIVADAVCELGIYSTMLADADTHQLLRSASAGHLLRSKIAGSDEGGISSGAGFIDSPYLV